MAFFMLRRARTGLLVLVSCMLIFAGLYQPAAAQTQTYTSQVTGVEITYNAPYTLESSTAEEGIEMLMFTSNADILSIGFLPASIDLNAARDVVLDALFSDLGASAQLDRGSYSGVSYSLDMMNIEGSELAVFTLFMNNRPHGSAEFYIYIAPPASFAATMQQAKNSFSVNGAGIFDGVDPNGLATMVNANIGITGGATTTTVTTETATQEAAPTEVMQQPTAEQQGGSNEERIAYINAVGLEFMAVNTSFGNLLGAIRDGNAGTLTPEEVVAIIDTEAAYLAGTSDRAAALTPPAGMEAFHQQYLDWAAAFTTLGTSWSQLRAGQITPEQFDANMQAASDLHSPMGDAWNAEVDKLSSQQPVEPTQEATTQATTEATQASGRTGRTTRGTTTESPTAEATQASGRTGRTTRGTTGAPTPTEVSNISETGLNGQRTTGEETPVPAPERVWEMPESGVTTVWSEEFFLYNSVEEAMVSDPETRADTLSLVWVSPQGQQMSITVTVGNNPSGSADGIVRTLSTNPEALAEALGPNAELMAADITPESSALLVKTHNTNNVEVWIYVQVTCIDASCGTVSLTTFYASPEGLSAMLTAANAGITVDGKPVTQQMSPDFVQDKINQFAD